MKSLSSAMQAHIAQDVTTLCTCWRMVKASGEVLGFTDHAEDISYNGVTYEASTGFTPSNLTSTENLSVDNMDLVGLLDSDRLSASAMLAGEYDLAEIYIFMLNYEDTSMGEIKLSYGTIGEVRTGRVVFEAEFRSLAQRLDQVIGETYTPTCRAELGDSRCGIVIDGQPWAARTAVSVGDLIKPSFSGFVGLLHKVTAAGITSSVEPTWATIDGDPTSEVGVDLVIDGGFDQPIGDPWAGSAWTISGSSAYSSAYGDITRELVQASPDYPVTPGASYTTSFSIMEWMSYLTDSTFDSAKGVYWDGGPEWSIAAGEASCDGTQTTETSLSSTPESMPTSVDWRIDFEIMSVTAGNVRAKIGSNVSTWFNTTGFKSVVVSASPGDTQIELQGDIDFAGSITTCSAYVETDKRARIVVGGTPGAWFNIVGVHQETIVAGSGSTIVLESDRFTRVRLDDVSVVEDSSVTYTAQDTILKKGTITSTTSNELFTDSSRAEAAGYFDQGVLTFVTGNNAGLSREIKEFLVGGSFQLGMPFPYVVQAGDTYYTYRGCDKIYSTCKNVFSNYLNFRGEPLVPGVDQISKFGNQK